MVYHLSHLSMIKGMNDKHVPNIGAHLNVDLEENPI